MPKACHGHSLQIRPMGPWALWGWLTMFGWFIAFSKLISIYLSRYILLYMDRYTYSKSILGVPFPKSPERPRNLQRGTPLNRPVSSRRAEIWRNDLAIFRMDMVRGQNGRHCFSRLSCPCPLLPMLFRSHNGPRVLHCNSIFLRAG